MGPHWANQERRGVPVLSRLFRRNRHEGPARALYVKIVDQARQPAFYRVCGVPDTLDGRFELIALHTFLVLHRLKRSQGETAELAQRLFDTLFLDMDASLRELGAGDLGVGRRVKAMAQGFYGRIAAYEDGLTLGTGELAAALKRNLYGTIEPDHASLQAMVAYLMREAGDLAAQDLAALMSGRVEFGAPPTGEPNDQTSAPGGRNESR